jgi:hypothetical protein
MNLRTCAALAATLTACGGDLDPGLAGTWLGTSVVALEGFQPYTYPSSLPIAVSGDTATVGNVCPTGGSLTVTGSGDSADWKGSLACPPISYAGCNAVAFTYQSATIKLRDNGGLLAEGSLTAWGCGQSTKGTLSFTGTR